MVGLLLLLLQIIPSCPVEGWRTSPYGWRHDPMSKSRRYHRGLDIGAPQGFEVRSMWTGTVVISKQMRSGYGNHVVVLSGERRVLYAHLDEILVSKGANVRSGALVGRVGQSGRATGPHLHIEIQVKRKRVDPDRFLQYCPDGGPNFWWLPW